MKLIDKRYYWLIRQGLKEGVFDVPLVEESAELLLRIGNAIKRMKNCT
ncbi:MAG: hypothetical protein HQK83_02250 [Fibrobacteria bacterium]|nr:hypothetical protein [Fibrobacteria bacterium]